MSNPMLQILVLAAIAIFLILRLRGVLGTRDGFEPTQTPEETVAPRRFDVIEGTAETPTPTSPIMPSRAAPRPAPWPR